MSAPTVLNPYPYTGAITGSVYAFDASGGYVMEAGFATVTTLPQTALPIRDVTNALQVTLPASVFNDKLVLSSYDETTQTFATSADFVDGAISLTASQFQTALASSSQIIGTGAYTNMYSNFQTYVTTYFGVPGGFASLFNQATLFALSGTDADNLYALFKPSSPVTEGETATGDEISGNYVKDLTGTITINNITQLLRYAVDTNVFNNRDPAGSGAGDPNNAGNFGVKDGFRDGDLIYVKEGTQITLDLDISPELYSTSPAPFNNPNVDQNSTFAGIGGTNTVSGLTAADSTITSMAISGDYSSISTVTRTNIKRVLKAPLLIRLTA